MALIRFFSVEQSIQKMKAVGAFLFFIGFIAIVAAKGIFFIKFVYLKWLVFYKFNKQMASISIQWINESDQNLFNGNRLALLLSIEQYHFKNGEKLIWKNQHGTSKPPSSIFQNFWPFWNLESLYYHRGLIY